MAKTIKERAKEYAKHNPSIIDGGDGRFEYDYESPRLDYIAGANAMLQEIEKSLDLGEPPYLISVEQAYYRTEKLIKELKGEEK